MGAAYTMVVDRAKLGRHKATNKDGTPCCIIGHAHEQLAGERDANGMLVAMKFGILYDHTRPEGMRWIGSINDKILDATEREATIIRLAQTIGVDVSFVGEYSK